MSSAENAPIRPVHSCNSIADKGVCRLATQGTYASQRPTMFGLWSLPASTTIVSRATTRHVTRCDLSQSLLG